MVMIESLPYSLRKLHGTHNCSVNFLQILPQLLRVHHELVSHLHIDTHHLETHDSQLPDPLSLTANQMFSRPVIIFRGQNQDCYIAAVICVEPKLKQAGSMSGSRSRKNGLNSFLVKLMGYFSR